MQSDSDKASLDRRQRAPAHAEARLKERGARHVGTLESLLPEAGCNLPRKILSSDAWTFGSPLQEAPYGRWSLFTFAFL